MLSIRSSNARRLVREARGFTILELAIVISVIGIVTALGLPSLSDVLRDNGVRSRAERYSEGLSLARLEAIQRNARVDFVADGVGWSITMPDPAGGSDLVLHRVAPGSGDANYTGVASATGVSFNGTGRASTGTFEANFGYSGRSCEAMGGDVRCLRVRLNARGTSQLCDPAVDSADPRACP
ncbi:MAG TPA: GspH/FimT family pseudopilin [Burkholderiaceae bacterium]|nr:GspH/FimT family pseudopilin [Burkholderiaceae bacterium]